jgi:DNA-binding CsgD family transcriptional regulator
MPGERTHPRERATTLITTDDSDIDAQRGVAGASSHEAPRNRVRGRATSALTTSSTQARWAYEPELRIDSRAAFPRRLALVIETLPTSAPKPPTPAGGGANASSPLADEARATLEATGCASALSTVLLVSAWRGRESLVLELITATTEAAPIGDGGRATPLTDYAKAVLYNGLGQYEEAAAAARRACAQGDLDLLIWALPELVEAAARSATRAEAGEVLRHFEGHACAGNDRALGSWALSAALLTDGAAAEALFGEAIDRFERGGMVVQLARAQLVYGEWLRRENRRLEAREQLRACAETFNEIGAKAFAQRARRELLATGETARKRTDDTRDVLTPQEAQIAALARDGYSNPQIGAQLFISPRTVQYHLRKVFQKLGITSRNQLWRIPASRLCVA